MGWFLLSLHSTAKLSETQRGRSREQTNTWEITRKLHHSWEHEWISNPIPVSEFNIQLLRCLAFWYSEDIGFGLKIIAICKDTRCDVREKGSDTALNVYMSSVKHCVWFVLCENIQGGDLTWSKNKCHKPQCQSCGFTSRLVPLLIWH